MSDNFLVGPGPSCEWCGEGYGKHTPNCIRPTGESAPLTRAQRDLLARLPCAPGDGIRVKGPAQRSAWRLVELGLARCTRADPRVGAYFVRVAGCARNA